MCGILGCVETNGLTGDSSRFDVARDLLTHRGPDEGRSWEDGCCRLGFRRLAILDLSEHGSQPMRSANHEAWIVFNGEIYNFVELRGQLEAGGVSFNGHSDTEVLLALYQRHGAAMLPMLDGMFAFAIYDRVRRKVLLARDRFGEKPLFLWRSSGGLAFASELRALRALAGFPGSVEPGALGEYFQLGFVPGHRCIWPGVSKLPPATFVEFDIPANVLSQPRHYWTVPTPAVPDAPPSLAEAVERTGQLLDHAVALRLRADVPLGCFLSGGIDSSLVAEAAARLSDGKVSTLTVKFPGWADDEEPVARETAACLGLRAIVMSLAAIGPEELAALCAHFDEPFADASMLPTALVCRAARRQFTVVLSGDGGDEAFGGYDNHGRAARWSRLDSIPANWRGWVGSALALAPRDSRGERFGRRLRFPTGRWGLGGKIYPFETTLAACLKEEFRANAIRLCAAYDEILGPVRGTALDEAQRTDLRVYLPDDVLVKSDRMSMLSSLEVRAPFLDHQLVEHGLRLPPAWRATPGQGKIILRRLAQKRGLPRAVWAGPKRGFGLPLHAWIFSGKQQDGLRRVFLGDGKPDAYFDQARLAGFWRQAARNPALTASVFRVLAFRWWEQGWAGGSKQ